MHDLDLKHVGEGMDRIDVAQCYRPSAGSFRLDRAGVDRVALASDEPVIL